MEQDGSMLNPHLKQERAAESWFLQHSQPQTTEGSKSRKKQSGPPQHAVIGARPFCSPEYSPDFYKLGSTVPHSTYSIPYSEKRRLLDKQKEMEEVKQLDEWRPTHCIGVYVIVLLPAHMHRYSVSHLSAFVGYRLLNGTTVGINSSKTEKQVNHMQQSVCMQRKSATPAGGGGCALTNSLCGNHFPTLPVAIVPKQELLSQRHMMMSIGLYAFTRAVCGSPVDVDEINLQYTVSYTPETISTAGEPQQKKRLRQCDGMSQELLQRRIWRETSVVSLLCLDEIYNGETIHIRQGTAIPVIILSLHCTLPCTKIKLITGPTQTGDFSLRNQVKVSVTALRKVSVSHLTTGIHCLAQRPFSKPFMCARPALHHTTPLPEYTFIGTLGLSCHLYKGLIQMAEVNSTNADRDKKTMPNTIISSQPVIRRMSINLTGVTQILETGAALFQQSRGTDGDILARVLEEKAFSFCMDERKWESGMKLPWLKVRKISNYAGSYRVL
ncbi:hypothetical protein D9C73_010180 [Collichthys lucidus]|uniref:Uncharacterized protein n=1 Tax=Collichthys lucidus TaxID=240159 RepID=A0A4U5ULP6_COLLU|nr:hypothetical protein D9C73_010180 [Collichthys lucidus]